MFLFESSGDRDPLLAQAQVEVVRGLLATAGPGDTVCVVAAGARVVASEINTRPTSESSVRYGAIDDLQKAHLVGALNLEAALAAGEHALSGSPE